MKTITLIILLFFTLSPDAQSRVKYPEGSMVINGVQLLQDHQNPLEYYYLPPYPTLSQKPDSTFEFLFMKYVGETDSLTGGIFHALFEYKLAPAEVDILEEELRKKVTGARIKGQVPLMEAVGGGPHGQSSFQIISSILNETGDAPEFTRKLITSGHAPVLPGSKAAISARLTANGATLLWHSFTSPTSDVSITIRAYFEAVTEAYNAEVKASMTSVYDHFRSYPEKKGYAKEEIFQIVDSLHNEGIFKVEVFDKNAGTDLNKQMDHILTILTDQLVDVLFTPLASWSETKSDTKKGNRLAFGMDDVIFILADKKIIRKDTITINLVKNTLLKVPVVSAGNLSVFYNDFSENDRYYRTVDLADPAFERREVSFQIDGEYAGAFEDIINFVSVDFRKTYKGKENPVLRNIHFGADAFEENAFIKTVQFPRLGSKEPNWASFEYRVTWSLKGRAETLQMPRDSGKWLLSDEAWVSLRPPLEPVEIEIDADRIEFQEQGIRSCVLQFASQLAGQPQVIGRIILRHNDGISTNKITLFKDPEAVIGYLETWYANNERIEKELQPLHIGYILLSPPATGG